MQKHFYQFKDNKTRWMNRPNNIQEDDFSQLLCLWSNKDVEKRCLQAKESRMSQTNMHTAGPKSFARIREEMKNYDPNQELPTLTKLFKRTRKRTEGRVYADIYDDIKEKKKTYANTKTIYERGERNDLVAPIQNRHRSSLEAKPGKLGFSCFTHALCEPMMTPMLAWKRKC